MTQQSSTQDQNKVSPVANLRGGNQETGLHALIITCTNYYTMMVHIHTDCDPVGEFPQS